MMILFDFFDMWFSFVCELVFGYFLVVPFWLFVVSSINFENLLYSWGFDFR